MTGDREIMGDQLLDNEWCCKSPRSLCLTVRAPRPAPLGEINALVFWSRVHNCSILGWKRGSTTHDESFAFEFSNLYERSKIRLVEIYETVRLNSIAIFPMACFRKTCDQQPTWHLCNSSGWATLRNCSAERACLTNMKCECWLIQVICLENFPFAKDFLRSQRIWLCNWRLSGGTIFKDFNSFDLNVIPKQF